METLPYPLLRFDGAVEHDPAVEAWLASLPDWAAPIARAWFAKMRGCGADVRELLHDGCPTACVGDAPFAYVHVFTSHAHAGFFHGASLADPGRLLEGKGKYMRHVKLRPGAPVDGKALEGLIAAAYRDIRPRLEAERGTPGPKRAGRTKKR